MKEWYWKSLPSSSHIAHFRAVIPKKAFDDLNQNFVESSSINDFSSIVSKLKKNTKFCVNLAATGQYGYEERMV